MPSNDGPHPQKGSFHGRHPPLSLSRHKVFSSKGGVAARGTSQFRKTCSRYRVFDRKRCVAEGKATQCPEICSRHKVFSSKGCVAARGTSQFRRVCSRYRVFDRKRCVAEGKAAQGVKTCSRYRVFSSKGCVAGRTRRVRKIGRGKRKYQRRRGMKR